MFDEVWRGDLPGIWRGEPPGAALSTAWPSLEIGETDQEYRVTAEVPGIDEKNLDLTLDDDVLVIRGEKRAETEDRERRMSERYYGKFERRIPFEADIDPYKVSASFNDGILTVHLPKKSECARPAQAHRHQQDVGRDAAATPSAAARKAAQTSAPGERPSGAPAAFAREAIAAQVVAPIYNAPRAAAACESGRWYYGRQSPQGAPSRLASRRS